MKKFLLSLVSLLICALSAVAAGNVKIAYAGSTTQNMTGENDAALFGLSAEEWSIVGDKGKASNMPGLNKDGSCRIYYNVNGSNTITITVLKEDCTIKKITGMTFNTGYDNVTVSVGDNPIEPVDGEYAINATSFVLGNGNTSNKQVQIQTIILDVEGMEGNYVEVHIANDAETAYSVARAIELIEAGDALDELVYVRGIVSQVDNFNAGAIQYWISDDGTTTNQFECYKGKGIGGADFASIDDVKVGASVIVKGTMKKYTPKEGDPIYEFNQNNELVNYEAPAEPVYIQNADFASLEGWTAVTSESYKDLGNGLIGTYQVRGEFDAATVDETHLATEYCIGLEARWNTNFASYTQTVTTLPAGSYSLVYDVENVNAATTAADYENRFTVTVGETVYSDSFTEWMKGKSAWTTHAIVFTVEEGQQVTISLGYGTGSNNLGVSNTPALFVSHLKLADAATGEALILAKAKEEKLAVLDAFVAGEGLFQYSQRAIEVAKRAVNAANTVEEVEAVDMPTPTLPDAEKQYTLQQKASGLYMSLSDGVKLAAKAYPLSWVATEGGWYIKNEDLYVGLAGSDNWTMSTDADKKLVITPAAIDIEGVVYYTLSEVKGMIASDGTEAGSACYTDKSVAKSGDKAYWAIAEYVAPVAYTVTISDEIANGTVVAAPTEAEAGETITLTITPAEGYELDQLEVLGANGAVVVVTDNTFTMPAANVRVFATFKEAASNDYTSYIKNADLSDASSTAWDTEGTKGYHKDVSGVVTAANNAVYDFKQTIEGLPAGKYKVSVQAAYRYGDTEQAEADAYFNDAIETKFAKLYATVGKKTVDVLVKNRYDGATDTDWADGIGSVVVEGKPVPNSTAAVKAWFDAKQYTNDLEFNLAEAGDVTIGIVKTAQPEAGDYTVIGPWTLTRLGDAEEEPEPTPDPTDYTSSIVNPSFETGDLTGWTVGSSSDTGVKPNSNATYTTEGCDGDHLFNTWWQGIPITQTVTGLPNGLYELKALMANDAGEGNADKPCLYLLANGTHSEAFGSGTKSKFTECSMQFYVTDGTATIGAIGGNTDGSFNEAGYYWYKVDNFRLTFIEALPNIDDIVIPEGKMSNAAATAITTAKEAGDVIALLDAVKVAQVSIVAYASAANAIADAKAIAANTNVYTAEAYETFAAAIEGVENAYNDGTLSDEAAAAAGATLGTVVTGWRAGAEGAAVKFMESAYNLNGFDGALYVNTWSTEGYTDGSDFAVPFYEYFTGGDQALAPQTFTTTVTGLEAGSYEVSALIRVQLKDGETVPAGITLDGNGGAAVDALGEEATSANLFLKETTTLATVGADGVLSININVLEGNNVHWLSFKNVKYAAKDETEYAYEKAIASIEDSTSYRIFTTVNEKKFYLNNTGYLVADANKAASFTFAEVNASGTLYETGINLGCKFTNPKLTSGATGDVVKQGHIIVGSYDRDNWERQVFFLKDGKYAVRATNANSEEWGANTYWTVDNIEAELPNAEYALAPAYVWEIEKYVDNRPAAYAKAQTWAAKLQAIEGLVTDAANWTTNAQETREGAMKNICDGDVSTFFHSQWSGTGPDADHYIQATLPEAAQKFHIAFYKRNDSNRPTSIVVSAGDAEPAQTITEGLPAPAWYSAEVDLGTAADVVRFTVPTTSTGGANNGHVYFTFGEFYILPSNELTDAACKYIVSDYTDIDPDFDPAEIESIDAQIEVAYQQAMLKEELADLAACIARGKEFIAAYPVEDAEQLAQEATGTLDRLAEGEYTTLEEIAVAKTTAILTVQHFIGATGTPTVDADITEWFVKNPTPIAHQAVAEGWEGDKFGDASDGVSEYWNKAAATFHQTITLPAGDYKLTVVALQRTDMAGVVYAGDAQKTIAQATTAEANNRGQAAAWFNAGNGVNEVKFTMAEAGEIEIGLITDNTTGDHWTVWQSFKIEKLAPVPPVAFTVTPNIASGTQAEFTTVEAGSALKLTVSTENLEANGYDPKDISLKVGTIFASRWSDKGFAMGTNERPPYMKNDIVLPLADEVTLADDVFGTEYPFIQSIRITDLSLVKGEEPIAAINEMIVISFIEVYENGKPVGIKAIATEGEKADIYDLSGRKVEKVQRGGIYIINGKKVSVK